jgi:hypothetical protein
MGKGTGHKHPCGEKKEAILFRPLPYLSVCLSLSLSLSLSLCVKGDRMKVLVSGHFFTKWLWLGCGSKRLGE